MISRNSIVIILLLSLASCTNAPVEETTHELENISNSDKYRSKIAFIADQGLTNEAKQVLQLIKEEGTDIVFHTGDFDYENSPDTWDEQINDVLGEDFPYVGIIGGAEVQEWPKYEKKIQDRISRTRTNCKGEIGVKSTCKYNDVLLVKSGIGVFGEDHLSYVQEALKENSKWKICLWHSNHNSLQPYRTKTRVPIEFYEECRKTGAFIINGDTHVYARTHLISNYETKQIANTENTFNIEKGKSFVIISGAGGRSFQGQTENANDLWWASVYSKDQNAKFGAFFCEFYEIKARCYFKDIEGDVIDEFNIISN